MTYYDYLSQRPVVKFTKNWNNKAGITLEQLPVSLMLFEHVTPEAWEQRVHTAKHMMQ